MIEDLRAVDFLSNFEPESRAQIIEFGKKISSPELASDVYLIMARKAICFVDLLLKFKLASLNGIIVTDRILDLNLKWLEGKTVTIIDDALVSGTTIRKVIDKLTTVIDQENIKVYVLSVNSEWYRRPFVNKTNDNNYEMLVRTDSEGNIIFDEHGTPRSYLVKPIVYQTNEKCMRTCFSIVKALSKTPMPYDVDFPLYDDWYISEKQLGELLNSSWIPIKIASIEYESDKYLKNKKEVTTETKCDSISFFPPSEIIQKIIAIFGIKSLSNGALKIRTYIRERKKERSRYHISFLPFVIINELSNAEIDEILIKIASRVGMAIEDIENIFNSYTSKFRLIQYLISAVLAREFFATNNILKIDTVTGQPNFPKISYGRMEYIFTQFASPIVQKMLEGLSLCNEWCTSAECYIEKIELNRDYLGLNPLIAFERLADVFLQLYYKKELTARKLAKNFGHKVFAREEYKDVVNRLNEGKTFNDLLNIQIPVTNLTNPEKSLIKLKALSNAELLVSVFLDYAIDIGIAVPITYSKQGAVSRAYRHGEDVIFSDEEARLLAYMLYEFVNYAMPDKEIGGLLAEKLFCTFIRLGLERNIFNKYDYEQINSQVREYLKITYNLHGSTVRLYNESTLTTAPKSYITPEDTSKWLWEILADKKLILASKNAKDLDASSHSIGFPDDCIEKLKSLRDSDKGISAERIAETLAYCYKNGFISVNDLVLLNAANGHAEIIPALLAEIEIIRNGFFIKTDYFLRKEFNGQHALNFLQSNRSGPVFTAMNSGKWKYEKFNEDFARTKINEIKEELRSKAPREIVRNWIQIWNENLSHTGDEYPNEISTIILREASFVIQFGLIYRVLEYLAFQKTIGADRIKLYFDSLREKVSKTEHGLKKESIEKYVSESDSNIVAYFKIVGADKKLNARSIFDDKFINDLEKAEVIIADIKEYLNTLISLNSLRPYCQSSTLIARTEQILLADRYEESSFDFMLKQIRRLCDGAETLQKNANKFVNNYGKIEKPTEYYHVALIRFVTEESKYLKDDVIKRIGGKRKKILRKDVDLNYCAYEDKIIVYTRGGNTDEALCRLIKEINNNLNLENDLEIFIFFDLKGEYRPYSFSSYMAPTNLSNCNEYMSKMIDEIYVGDSALMFITLDNSAFCKSANMKEATEKKMIINGEVYKVRAISKEDNQECINKKGFTIGIICAKPTELEGVNKAVANKFKIEFADCLDEKENYRRYLQAEIINEKVCHKIILTLCEQGNTGSAIAYDSIAHFKPDYVFFCGIAGSCDSKINIGDVFIPFTIVDATLKKVTDDKIQIRGDAYRIPSHHIGLMQQFIDLCLREIRQEGLGFNISNEKAMSDNAVIACNDSKYLQSILSVNDKAVACVEMESAGLFDADYTRHKSRYGVYSIRGISDKANTDKDDSHHPIAIKNASKVASDLIKFLINHYEQIQKMKI